MRRLIPVALAATLALAWFAVGRWVDREIDRAFVRMNRR